MKLWLLYRDECDFDEYEKHLIRAKSQKRARQIANNISRDEGKIWEDKELVKCKQIKIEGKEEIIISDFLEA